MLVVIVGGVGMMGCQEDIAIQCNTETMSISELNDFIRSYPNSAKAYYDRGVAYYANEEYNKALSDFNKCIYLNSNYTPAYAGRDEAYEKVAATGADTIDAQMRLLIKYQKMKDFKKLAEVCKEIIRIEPNYKLTYSIYHTLGSCYIQLNQPAEAIHALEKSVSIRPSEQAYISLSDAYNMNGEFNKGLGACNNAIMLNPDYSLAYYCMAGSYNLLGWYQEAIDACNKSISLKPRFAPVHYRLGESLYFLGRYKEAIGSCKKSVELNPDFARVHFILGNNYAALGNVNSSIESYKRAMLLEPNFVAEERKYLIDAKNLQKSYVSVTYYDIGMLHFLLGERDSALDIYEILKSIDKNMADKLLNVINK
jgi:tetratricopeptide (TPR) repeat protein